MSGGNIVRQIKSTLKSAIAHIYFMYANDSPELQFNWIKSQDDVTHLTKATVFYLQSSKSNTEM